MVTPAPRRSLPIGYEDDDEVQQPQAEIIYLHVLAEPSFYRRRGKRLLDLAISIPLCLIAAPIVAALAIIVVVTSGWPAFYGARRVGLNGKPFRMWKLRSMVKDADCLPEQWREMDPEKALIYFQSYKLKDDPRTTRLGRFLRKTSLDELPQLCNVLRGDMSLVGPRPIVAAELENYSRSIDAFLSARPGITGFWQTSGRSSVDYPERARMELDYVGQIALVEDVRLLLLTVPSVLFCRGAH